MWRRGVGNGWPIILSLGVTLMMVPPSTAAASSVTVTTLLDTNTPGDGKCSLREAVNNITTQSETTMGDCATGVSTGNIDFSVSGTITLSMGVISLGGSLTIEGGNAITLDGGGSNQIFDVHTLIYLNDLTISNGHGANGGAITVVGALHVINCSFVGNSASSKGGAIYASGGAELEITNSIFDGNAATLQGGAIYAGAASGQLIVTTSTFKDNEVNGSGGAISNDGSTTQIDRSTFEGNSASAYGGAIVNNHSLTVTSSTFSANGEAGGNNGGAIANLTGGGSTIRNSTFAGNLGSNGGGTYNSNGLVQLQFCTFSGNSATHGGAIYDESTRPDGTSVNATILTASPSGGNCDASLGNLADGQTNISDDKSCGFVGTGDGGQALGDGVNPMLDPAGLKNNGGPTQTIADQPGGPGVDAISHSICANASYVDQRGDPRPDAEDGGFFASCDVGAYELDEAAPTPTPTDTPSPTITPSLTPSLTLTPSTTPTITRTPTPTRTPTETSTVTASATPTPSVTPGKSSTPAPTRTGAPPPSPTASPTPTRTGTRTPSPTPSPTRTGTRTATPTPSPSPTPTRTPTPNGAPTATPNATSTPTPTPTPVPGSPSVTSISPTSGASAGGTAVTITGSNFVAGATVTIGGAAATNVVVVDGATITCKTPVLPAGTLNDVVVTISGAVVVKRPQSSGTLVKGWFADFADVPHAFLYHAAIEKVVRAGITAGCGNGNFCPDDPVTRDAMAKFLLVAKHGAGFNPPAATGTVFCDVSVSTLLAKWIEEAKAEGIANGAEIGACGKPNYHPTDAVTRDAMAKFLELAKNGSSFSPPAATGNVFCDVPAGALLAKWMEQLKADGITQGCTSGPCARLGGIQPDYCPTNTVTRGEMARFIVRAFGL